MGLVIYLTVAKKIIHSRFDKLVPVGFICLVGVVGFICLNSNLFYKPKTVALAQNKKSMSPLGDLTPFINIAEDSLKLVEANDLSRARIRIKDLEIAWDEADAKLRPMNTDVWASVDLSIDKVLTKLRVNKPDKGACMVALKAFIEKSKEFSK